MFGCERKLERACESREARRVMILLPLTPVLPGWYWHVYSFQIEPMIRKRELKIALTDFELAPIPIHVVFAHA